MAAPGGAPRWSWPSTTAPGPPSSSGSLAVPGKLWKGPCSKILEDIHQFCLFKRARNIERTIDLHLDGEGNKLSIHLAVVQFGAVPVCIWHMTFSATGNEMKWQSLLRSRPLSTSAKFWGVWTPSPLVRKFTQPPYWALVICPLLGLPPPLCVDVLYGWPLTTRRSFIFIF